jgi:hypothetical protein
MSVIYLLREIRTRNIRDYENIRQWLVNKPVLSWGRHLVYLVCTNIRYLERLFTLNELKSYLKFAGLVGFNTINKLDSMPRNVRMTPVDTGHIILITKVIDNIYDSEITKRAVLLAEKNQDPVTYLKELDSKITRPFTIYRNMTEFSITPAEDPDKIDTGLRLIGRTNVFNAPAKRIKTNADMRRRILQSDYNAPIGDYQTCDATLEMVLTEMQKYQKKNLKVNFSEIYKGMSFMDFLFNELDYMYNIPRDLKVRTRTLNMFSEEDYTDNSKKAYPGLRTRLSGYQTKTDRLNEQIEMARSFRQSVLEGREQTHYWSLFAVPKTYKRDKPEIRVILAPENYWYINQYLIFEPFIHIVNHSKVSNKFSLFGRAFDRTVRALNANSEKETLDLRKMGSQTQREIFDVFHKWYGRFMSSDEDRQILNYMINDMCDSTFVLPKQYGGGIYKKSSGLGDGGYGTNQFNTFVMTVYYTYNVWKNIISEGISPQNSGIRNVIIENHSDNWIHSYPSGHRWLSWNEDNLRNMGQTVKDEIIRSKDINQHELMGFKITQDRATGTYVGIRSYAKTIKSLYYNKHRYKDINIQAAYEAGLIRSLILVDCWEPKSENLLLALNNNLQNVTPLATDFNTAESIEVLEKYGFNPKNAWLEQSPLFFELSKKDPEEDIRWILEEKYKGESDT